LTLAIAPSATDGREQEVPDKELERDGLVQELTIDHDGQSYSAVYFVEHGQIHVKTGDRLYRLARNEASASDAVRGLLLGLAAESQRKHGQSTRWAGALSPQDEPLTLPDLEIARVERT
jgi:hypothetical protein